MTSYCFQGSAGSLASEDYDITDQMWAYGWAIDDQGKWSEDHIAGLPNIEASPADDWISGWNFAPNRPVRIEIQRACHKVRCTSQVHRT